MTPAIIGRAVSRLLEEKPSVKSLGEAESFSGGSLIGGDPETRRGAARFAHAGWRRNASPRS